MKQFLVTVAGIGLASALTAAPVAKADAADFDCTVYRHHCIKVTVDSSHSPATLSVDVPDLYKVGPDHVIHWILDNAQGQAYAFTNTSITFKTAAGVREFKPCNVDASNPIYFHCKDHAGATGTYEYTLTVSGANQLDPRIINN